MKRKPDFSRLRRVLLRQGEPDYLPFYEHGVAWEIIETLTEKKTPELDTEKKEDKKKYLEILAKFYSEYGYDYLPLRSSLTFPRTNVLRGRDTACLSSGGERTWVDEHHGVIESWQDFEKYPWMKKEEIDYFEIEYAGKIAPEGMKGIVHTPGGILENLMWLMSYEVVCYKLFEEPQLIEAILDKLGTLMCYNFETLVDYEIVGGLLISDDLGFKTQTMISPQQLRKYIFPWHKKLTEIGHKHNLPVLLHSCGNLEEVMDDIIDDVGIDAKHSYEDIIMPVAEVKKKYGNRVAVVGGVDMNVLAGKSEPEVREYVRNIVRVCAPGGGYVLGSGNSIPNYIPAENYLAMLDEGSKYRY